MTLHLRSRLLCSSLLAAAALQVQPAAAQSTSELTFLVGHWREQTERETTYETWLGPLQETMVSVNLSQRGERASFEYLRIARRDGRLILFASPGGRHPPTEFALKELAADRVVFENLAHDFPQRVIYRRDGDRLLARIEGVVGGQPRGKDWVFQRAP